MVILVDTNMILDVLLKREPYSTNADGTQQRIPLSDTSVIGQGYSGISHGSESFLFFCLRCPAPFWPDPAAGRRRPHPDISCTACPTSGRHA